MTSGIEAYAAIAPKLAYVCCLHRALPNEAQEVLTVTRQAYMKGHWDKIALMVLASNLPIFAAAVGLRHVFSSKGGEDIVELSIFEESVNNQVGR